jgi:uncharacterized protein (TIGR03066 family)
LSPATPFPTITREEVTNGSPCPPPREVVMKLLPSVLIGCLILGLAGCRVSATSAPKKAPPEEKKAASNKEKLIGVWELTKSKEGAAGNKVEFFADGKMRMTLKVKVFKKKGDNKKVLAKETTEVFDATYMVDGDKLTMTVKVGDKEEKRPLTIRSLTDKELVMVDEEGNVDEFKKK